uniref:Uncharacterized protein n=1 Tax=uncultured marine microorganism HF4000_ANIW137I15 TaxID=455531 RepID=B3T4M6_9ZZZZ|nr:hypothetical protein ALOHA_HF4000ANIW137I15ctg3g25 [uncultured marine microorganism HF4000_ANIW137I15]
MVFRLDRHDGLMELGIERLSQGFEPLKIMASETLHQGLQDQFDAFLQSGTVFIFHRDGFSGTLQTINHRQQVLDHMLVYAFPDLPLLTSGPLSEIVEFSAKSQVLIPGFLEIPLQLLDRRRLPRRGNLGIGFKRRGFFVARSRGRISIL